MADFSLTTFSQKGELLQIQYALKAVAKGETALGIKAKNGVVIAVEKKLSTTLIDEESLHKINLISGHIGAVYAGLGPDFKALIQMSRKNNISYQLEYGEQMYVNSLCRLTAETVQEYTQSGGVRPFGCSLLVAGYDDNGPHLYQIDPSGAYYGWKATSIGKNQKNAKAFLEKRFKPDMEIEDAIQTALLTLKEGYEGQMKSNNVEVGVIGTDRIFRILTPKQIEDYLNEVN